MGQRYEHSVLDLIGRLHRRSTGTEHESGVDQETEEYNWLKWRLNSAWEKDLDTKVEQLILKLGKAVLKEYEDSLKNV